MDDFDCKKFKILIVDDIPQNIQVLGSTLATHKYQIAYAENGKKALSVVKLNKFDLILLDIMMPELDGFEVCRQIKSDDSTKEIPIIFLTAKTDTESITKAFELGGQDYLTKPFNAQELLSRVKTHLILKIRKEEVEKQKRELEKMNKKLEATNAAKDKFFSIIAHDLKNPFGDLTSLSELLQNNLSRYDVKKTERFINEINKLSKSGYALLENLLEWSRAQTGRLKLSPENIDLKLLIDDILILHSSKSKDKQISIKNLVDQNIKIMADKNMTHTIMRNLIGNAIKFTGKNGKVNINASNSAIINGENFVEIAVSDTGIGISKEDIKKLFRIDINHITIGTASEKGTGLGLILCKEFVNRHEGEIWVESKLGEGSDFVFMMPAGE